MAASSETEQRQLEEIARLRERVAALEQELVEQSARTHRVVAQAQERLYWLDRWHVDLNALMRRQGAAEFRAVVRAVRKVTRGLKKVKRRLSRAS